MSNEARENKRDGEGREYMYYTQRIVADSRSGEDDSEFG